jgi:ribose-phosphate pyrophosphokinase
MSKMSAGIKIFSGRATQELSNKLSGTFGYPLGDVKVTQFSDGEFQPSYCSIYNATS